MPDSAKKTPVRMSETASLILIIANFQNLLIIEGSSVSKNNSFMRKMCTDMQVV